MKNQLVSSLKTCGFIPALRNFGTQSQKNKEKGFSIEDYVGRITMLFYPYVSDIPESKFIRIQSEIRDIICEIKG